MIKIKIERKTTYGEVTYSIEATTDDTRGADIGGCLHTGYSTEHAQRGIGLGEYGCGRRAFAGCTRTGFGPNILSGKLSSDLQPEDLQGIAEVMRSCVLVAIQHASERPVQSISIEV